MTTTLKVIGAGWGRTGTTSTLAALNELGFGPCYTFYTIMSEKPEHFARWQAAYAGERMDWPALFAGFNSVVDWPACDFYPEILKQWPEAKVLLNVRDPESWYTSMVNTIWQVYEDLRRAGQTPESSPLYRLGQTMLWEGTFHGRFEDKAYAMGLFEQHNARVKASLPADKLLVFDVKQGWEPLCRFLNVPVPDQPFPRVNDTQAFHARLHEDTAGAHARQPEPAMSV
jgi:hypothetical protein